MRPPVSPLSTTTTRRTSCTLATRIPPNYDDDDAPLERKHARHSYPAKLPGGIAVQSAVAGRLRGLGDGSGRRRGR